LSDSPEQSNYTAHKVLTSTKKSKNYGFFSQEGLITAKKQLFSVSTPGRSYSLGSNNVNSEVNSSPNALANRLPKPVDKSLSGKSARKKSGGKPVPPP